MSCIDEKAFVAASPTISETDAGLDDARTIIEAYESAKPAPAGADPEGFRLAFQHLINNSSCTIKEISDACDYAIKNRQHTPTPGEAQPIPAGAAKGKFVEMIRAAMSDISFKIGDRFYQIRPEALLADIDALTQPAPIPVEQIVERLEAEFEDSGHHERYFAGLRKAIAIVREAGK